jgi:elongation factor P
MLRIPWWCRPLKNGWSSYRRRASDRQEIPRSIGAFRFFNLIAQSGEKERFNRMYSTADFRKGLRIEIENKPYLIVDFQHVKPGKGGAFVRTKLKNLLNGRVTDQTFRSGEKVDRPDLEEKEMQFLYREGDKFVFMDNQSYDQVELSGEQVGDQAQFLQENISLKILNYRQEPIGLELPTFVELTVTATDPGMKGDTASGGSKPATLETGYVIQVPLFIAEGDKLRIDTRTGAYIERAK